MLHKRCRSPTLHPGGGPRPVRRDPPGRLAAARWPLRLRPPRSHEERDVAPPIRCELVLLLLMRRWCRPTPNAEWEFSTCYTRAAIGRGAHARGPAAATPARSVPRPHHRSPTRAGYAPPRDDPGPAARFSPDPPHSAHGPRTGLPAPAYPDRTPGRPGRAEHQDARSGLEREACLLPGGGSPLEIVNVFKTDRRRHLTRHRASLTDRADEHHVIALQEIPRPGEERVQGNKRHARDMSAGILVRLPDIDDLNFAILDHSLRGRHIHAHEGLFQLNLLLCTHAHAFLIIYIDYRRNRFECTGGGVSVSRNRDKDRRGYSGIMKAEPEEDQKGEWSSRFRVRSASVSWLSPRIQMTRSLPAGVRAPAGRPRDERFTTFSARAGIREVAIRI